MRIYLTHSSGYDYKTELYEPIKETLDKEHDIFFPHDEHKDGFKSKDLILTCDVVLAEVSYPSIGEGIELGWADAGSIPIICFYRQGSEPSSATQFISSSMVEYKSKEDMVEKLQSEIANINLT